MLAAPDEYDSISVRVSFLPGRTLRQRADERFIRIQKSPCDVVFVEYGESFGDVGKADGLGIFAHEGVAVNFETAVDEHRDARPDQIAAELLIVEDVPGNVVELDEIDGGRRRDAGRRTNIASPPDRGCRERRKNRTDGEQYRCIFLQEVVQRIGCGVTVRPLRAGRMWLQIREGPRSGPRQNERRKKEKHVERAHVA